MSEQREAFEQAVTAEFEKPVCLDRDGEGYADGYVDSAWWGYKAALSSAPSAKPVAWMHSIDRPEHDVGYDRDYFTVYYKPTPGFCIPLYLAPPHLSAAVAAAREQDASVCDEMTDWPLDKHPAATIDSNEYLIGIQRGLINATNAIRALQSPDGLAELREFGFVCFKAGQKANSAVDSQGRKIVEAIVAIGENK